MVYANMRLPETNDLSYVPVLRSCICLFTSPLYTYLLTGFDTALTQRLGV